MRSLSTLLLLFLSMCCATHAFAQTSIKAELDKTKLTTDETVIYKLVITSSERKLPPPEVADFNDFVLISQAQSSTVSFVKGTARTILVYAFILAPTRTGKFKIGPSSLKLKQSTLSTEEFEVEVTEGKNNPVFPRKSPVPERNPQESFPEEEKPEQEEMPRYNL